MAIKYMEFTDFNVTDEMGCKAHFEGGDIIITVDSNIWSKLTPSGRAAAENYAVGVMHSSRNRHESLVCGDIWAVSKMGTAEYISGLKVITDVKIKNTPHLADSYRQWLVTRISSIMTVDMKNLPKLS